MASGSRLRPALLVVATCIGSGLIACGGSGTSDENPFADPGSSRPDDGDDDDDTTGGSSSGRRSSSSSSGGRSSSGSTTSSGGGGSSGASSTSSSSSSGAGGSTSSSSGAPGCEDEGDAPDFEGALDYPAVNAPNATPHALAGVLDGDFDVDWYGFDITGSPVTAVSLGQALPAELCVYQQCKAGTLTLTCPAGATNDTDDDGVPGCCVTGSAASAASLTTYMYCSPGADDNYTMIRVTSLADQCADYTVSAKF